MLRLYFPLFLGIAMSLKQRKTKLNQEWINWTTMCKTKGVYAVFPDSMWHFFAVFLLVMWPFWMHRERWRWFFDLSKELVWRLEAIFFWFHSFLLALNWWYTEWIFQAINVLNALFWWQRELSFNDEGIIFTVMVRYLKKCVTLIPTTIFEVL